MLRQPTSHPEDARRANGPEPAQAAPNGRARWRGALAGSRRALPRWALVAVGVAVLALLGVLLRAATSQPTPQSPPAEGAPPAPKLVARGQVRPIAQSRVGTLSGGVVAQLAVDVGDAVEEQQVIGRVRGPAGAEVLTAPRRGTIASLPVQVGDTVPPGATVAVVADLSRLVIETTDVDEYLVGQVRKGQAVTIQVDAIERRDVRGRVRTITPQPQLSPRGDEHYPVVVDLDDTVPGLRAGMTAKVDFGR